MPLALEKLATETNKTKLKSFLLQIKKPVYETLLLKNTFDSLPSLNALPPLELYHYHFALFHMLYQLQTLFYQEEKYLHVHFMRTHLTAYPEKGNCRYYQAETGKFCCTPLSDSSSTSLCSFHKKLLSLDEDPLETSSIKYFYLSTANYTKLTDKNAEAFLNGSWELLYHYDEFQQAVQRLDLPENCTIEMLKKRYYQLAKKYHPDQNGDTALSEFLAVNDAYRFLLKLLPTIRGKT